MKPFGSFLDGSFGEARGLEEAAGRGRVASGVEGGRRFGLVGSDGGVWVGGRCGADLDFKAVQGAFRFGDAVPAEGRARFGKRGNPARRFAVVGARFHGSQSVAVKNETQNDIKNHGGECEGCAYFAARAFLFGSDFLGDPPAERGGNNSCG